MTTELEKQFYKTFGIEPKNKCGKNLIYPNCLNTGKCRYDNCIYYQIEYPKITAEKLLQMICVLSQWDADNYYQILANNMQDLKNEILNDCINFKQKLKNEYFNAEIQQLFKEEE